MSDYTIPESGFFHNATEKDNIPERIKIIHEQLKGLTTHDACVLLDIAKENAFKHSIV